MQAPPRPSPAVTSAARVPEILAPAGDEASCLAALAAGADAVYAGMKHFSARMEAANFSLQELARMSELAHKEGRRIYVAFNTMIKPSETDAAFRLLVRLRRQVCPDGIILQDIGALALADQAALPGGRFLSTLANITHPAALRQARAMGATRVILPRELSLAEVRTMGEACPEGLDLECFVHGALCLCVSGRCYWSSYLGGKSGLRGRCVQPCRRAYSLVSASGRPGKGQSSRPGHGQTCFSCLDLSLDMAARELLTVPHLVSWKIEGRRKGSHYVYHVVKAYRLIRDEKPDRRVAQEVTRLLAMALGRATTRARFLPGSQAIPTGSHQQTSSGYPVGHAEIRGGVPVLLPRIPLQPGDLLRLGTEGQPGHATLAVRQPVAKGEVLHLDHAHADRTAARTPVYLIDRRDRELAQVANLWRKKYEACRIRPTESAGSSPQLPPPVRRVPRKDMLLMPGIPRGQETRGDPRSLVCLWLSPRGTTLSRTVQARFGWWLPPVVWPGEEEELQRQIRLLMRNGVRHFVCNAPWQRDLFPHDAHGLDLLAGPFCNTANASALGVLAGLGFAGAFASPELDGASLLSLAGQSPLPLGLVLSGYWPVGLSRFAATGGSRERILASPMGERFWTRQYGGTTWIYPAWPLDLLAQREELAAAGFSFFAHMREHPPKGMIQPAREGRFNWAGQLL